MILEKTSVRNSTKRQKGSEHCQKYIDNLFI